MNDRDQDKKAADFEEAILSVPDDPVGDDIEPTVPEAPTITEPEAPRETVAEQDDFDSFDDDLVERTDTAEPSDAESAAVETSDDSPPASDVQAESPAPAPAPAPTPEPAKAAATEPAPSEVHVVAPRDEQAEAVRVSGIDLGTTYSAISSYNSNRNLVETISLQNIAEGLQSVPSVVYYPAGGEPAVGSSAVNAAGFEPDRVVRTIKRAMGTSWKKTIDDRELTPESVSADILKAVYGEAGQYIAADEKRVVVTVPAHFEDAELDSTREAVEQAGLDVLTLLPEPHAAALAFTVERQAGIVEDETMEELLNKYLLVFDLGGGTLDVSLIRIAASKDTDGRQSVQFQTIFKDGNRRLGGVDWDDELQKLALEKHREQVGDEQHDLAAANPGFEPNVLASIERGKRSLSIMDAVKIVIGFTPVEVTREEFEDVTAYLLERSEIMLDDVLKRAEEELGEKRSDIPVVMAGGSTHMPQVPEMIRRVAGSEPLESQNPDLLVTTGAAYWAHLLAGGGELPGELPLGSEDDDVVLTVPKSGGGIEIVNYSVGVKTFVPDDKGKYTVPVFSEIIPCESRRGPVTDELEGRLDDFLQDAKEKCLAKMEEGYAAMKEALPKNDPTVGMFCDVFCKAQDGMGQLAVDVYSSKEPVGEDATDERKTQIFQQAEKMGGVTMVGLPASGKRGDPVLIALAHDREGILHGRSLDVKSGVSKPIVIKRKPKDS